MKHITRFLLIACVMMSISSCSPPLDSKITEEPVLEDPDYEPEPNSEEAASSDLETEKDGILASIPDKPLSEDGPWLIINSTQGFFAVNPDGSGLTQFVQGLTDPPYNRKLIASERGGYFAYYASTGKQTETRIRIISFPIGDQIAEIPVLSYSEDIDMSAISAVIDRKSFVFSPDGSQLAFMGVIDGPTSDLYRYTLDTEEILQLTDGSTQGYQPVWSPDGKYILHTGADGFGSGAGFQTEGIWIAEAENGNVKTLYTPPVDAAEMVLGWVDEETFVVYSWNFTCGGNNLRTYNINNDQSAILWEEPFNEIAFDPASATIVLTTWDDAVCSPKAGAGTYFIPIFGGEPERVSEVVGPIVEWSPPGRLFLVSGSSIDIWYFGVTTDGQIVNLDWPSDVEYMPSIASGSDHIFWLGDSPRISSMDPSMPTVANFNEPIRRAVWTPDGTAVFFIAKSGGLFIAQQPDFLPVLISADIETQMSAGFMEWVNPK